MSVTPLSYDAKKELRFFLLVRMSRLVISSFTIDPQEKNKKKFPLIRCIKRNELAKKIKLHWGILSDTFISINRSNETVLSIDIWHFKSTWWHRYRLHSVPSSGTKCRPHVQTIPNISSTINIRIRFVRSITNVNYNFSLSQSLHLLSFWMKSSSFSVLQYWSFIVSRILQIFLVWCLRNSKSPIIYCVLSSYLYSEELTENGSRIIRITYSNFRYIARALMPQK